MSDEFEVIFSKTAGFSKARLSGPPELLGDQVLVRPKWVGICGTDLYLMQTRSEALRLGHEWVGVVEAVGPDVSGLRHGDVITGAGSIVCFNCPCCGEDRTNLCERSQHMSSPELGALRTWLVIPQKQICRIDEPLRKDLVLHELIAVSETALSTLSGVARITDRELLIFGAGPVGLMTAQIALHSGLRPVLVERLPERVRLARKPGIESISLANALVDSAFRRRFDLWIDASNDYSGDPGAFRLIPYFSKPGFTGLVVGKYVSPQSLPAGFDLLAGTVIWMKGVPHSAMRKSVSKWTNQLEKLSLDFISHTFNVNEVSEAFEVAASRKSSMKVVVAFKNKDEGRSLR